MTKQSLFIETAKKALSRMPLKPVEIDPSLQNIEVEGGTVTVEVYSTDKIEKAVICTIAMHETGVAEETVLVWPDEEHNFPILWANLTIVPDLMNVPICDFIPLMDIVVWPEYAERYIQCVGDLKAEALGILGDTVADKAVDMPSLTTHAFSPYRLVARVSDDGVALVPRAAQAYIERYCELWQQADPVREGPERDFYRQKRAATRTLMKENDPGYAFMVDVFGEEQTRAVFDLVF